MGIAVVWRMVMIRSLKIPRAIIVIESILIPKRIESGVFICIGGSGEDGFEISGRIILKK